MNPSQSYDSSTQVACLVVQGIVIRRPIIRTWHRTDNL